MTADSFFDTSILVYAVSERAEDVEKRAVASRLFAQENFGLSTQVLQEFYVTVTRKYAPAMSPQRFLGILEQLKVFPIVAVDTALVTEGIGCSIRYKTSHWDGAIIAAAKVLGAKKLFTEDLNHGQLYAGVRVVNPFQTD